MTRPRRVLFFPGFDPAKGARYRRLIQACADASGAVTFLKEKDQPDEKWRCSLSREGVETQVVIRPDYLDISHQMHGTVLWRALRQLLSLGGLMLRGDLGRFLRVYPPFVALLSGISVFLLVLMVLMAAILWPLGLIDIAALIVFLFFLFRGLKSYRFVEIQDYLWYFAKLARGRELEAIFNETERILTELRAEGFIPDLIVGHSLGALPAIYAARSLKSSDLVTLGGTHAMLLCAKDAQSFKDKAREALEGGVWCDLAANNDVFCPRDLSFLEKQIEGLGRARYMPARFRGGGTRAAKGEEGKYHPLMLRHLIYLLPAARADQHNLSEIMTQSAQETKEFFV